jgi:hypothetical protein
VLVTNVGTGSEMEGAIICGLDVVGLEMSGVMYSCAANRLANVMQAQAYRRDLAKLEATQPEDYVAAARLTLPDVVLTSPDKRQRAHLQKNSMPSILILYHGILGLDWPLTTKSLAQRVMETALKLYIQ